MISGLKNGIAEIKSDFDKFKQGFDKFKQGFDSIFQPQTTPTRPTILYFKEVKKNDGDHKLEWIIDDSTFKEKASEGKYNMYLKFTAFSDSQDDKDTTEKQKASTQIALLKLKLINFGMKNSVLDLNDGSFKNNDTIIKMLQEVENRGVTNNTLKIDDDETLTYCKEFVSLGQQCKRIEDNSDNKDNIFERVAHEFKKGLIRFSCQDVKKYRILRGEQLIKEITSLSATEIDKINEAEKNKIILLNALLIPLTEACIGHEKISEIEKKTTSAVPAVPVDEITSEIAKVFVELDYTRAKSFFSELQHNQQTKLIELIKEEAEYSELAQKQALGDFYFFLKNEFLDNYMGRFNRFTTPHRFKTKSKDEVFDFFKKRKEKCEEILKCDDFKITPQSVDANLNPPNADEIKGNPNEGIMDLFASIKKKIEEVSKINTDRGAEAEAAGVVEGVGEAAAGVGLGGVGIGIEGAGVDGSHTGAASVRQREVRADLVLPPSPRATSASASAHAAAPAPASAHAAAPPQ